MGSLKNESVERLEEAGILSSATGDENQLPKAVERDHQGIRSLERKHEREVCGNPWFEEVIDGSALGRIKRRRGGQSSADGRTKVEWEVVEIGGDDEEITNTSKRKLGSLGNDDEDDVEMRH